jgi:nucleoside-diphosphate-sugar epimerase
MTDTLPGRDGMRDRRDAAQPAGHRTGIEGPVVVTGAAGFIGTHLSRTLGLRGIEVRAIDVRPPPVRFRLETVRYFERDIRDTEALAPVLTGADTVYNLASAQVPANGNRRLLREVNVEAAHGLVEACAHAGVRRLVHASTASIHGHVANPPAREDAPTAPADAYDRSKLEGEIVVRRVAAAAGVELIVLRPSWVYGPGCPRMAALLHRVRRGRFVYLGEGRNLRHLVYIGDALEAFLLAATASAHRPGRAYHIAGPRFVELRELVEACARIQGTAAPRLRLPREVVLAVGRASQFAWGAIGREPPLSWRSLSAFEEDQAYDITAARRDLGFEPGVGLAEGVRMTAQDRVRLIGT